METISIFLNILLFYLIIRTTFRLFASLITAKKLKEQAINKKVMEPVEVVEEMVQDKICGAILPRSKSYILVRNDQEHYFCSWECRQKFLDSVVLDGAGSLT